MRKSRFTESQIIMILAQQEQGLKVSDIYRELSLVFLLFITGRASIQVWMSIG